MDPQTSRPPIPLEPDARATLADWVREHWDGVFGLAYRLSGSRHEADDLAQEAFLKAASRRELFEAGTNLRAWLLRIVTNTFLDSRRRKQTSRSEQLPEQPPDVDAPGPGKAIENEELAEALSNALKQLPETSRAVFLLRTQEEMSFRDIGQAIGATEETARWHMLQARRRLMKLLDGWM